MASGKIDLEWVVAQWSLSLFPPERMPAVAAWALEEGFDGPALRELAGLASATRSGGQALIERALRELGKEPLDLSAAGLSSATLLCKQIVAGTISPYEGAKNIWRIYNRCGMPQSLARFVGCASEWEDDVDHRDHYDKLIIEAAKKFLLNPSDI